MNFKDDFNAYPSPVHIPPPPAPSTHIHTQNLPSSWHFFSRIEPDFFTTHPQTTVSGSLPLYHPRFFLFAHKPLQNNARTLLKDSDLSVSGSIPFLLLHLYWSSLQLYLFLLLLLLFDFVFVCFLGTTSNCGLILN